MGAARCLIIILTLQTGFQAQASKLFRGAGYKARLGVVPICCALQALACNTALRIGSRSLLAHYEHQEQADYKQSSDISDHEDQRGGGLATCKSVKYYCVE